MRSPSVWSAADTCLLRTRRPLRRLLKRPEGRSRSPTAAHRSWNCEGNLERSRSGSGRDRTRDLGTKGPLRGSRRDRPTRNMPLQTLAIHLASGRVVSRRFRLSRRPVAAQTFLERPGNTIALPRRAKLGSVLCTTETGWQVRVGTRRERCQRRPNPQSHTATNLLGTVPLVHEDEPLRTGRMPASTPPGSRVCLT